MQHARAQQACGLIRDGAAREHALMGEPTLGVMANGGFYFNENAQWEPFGEDGKISDPLRLREAVVLSVPLR